MRKLNLLGRVFGRLTITEEVLDNGPPTWRALCSCGAVKDFSSACLLKNKTTSCGCYKRELDKTRSLTHGLSKTREYKIWGGMIQRVKNSERGNYVDRGITLDPNWLIFENFFSDMGAAPSASHSIDRENNDKGYCKSNCRWATDKQQARNKSNTLYIEFEGERKSISEWAEIKCISMHALYWRIVTKKWPVGRALNTPSRKKEAA